MTGEIFVTVMALAFMTVSHGPGLKQNFFSVHTWCSNLVPRFLVYAEFNNKRRLRLVAALE